MSTKSMVKLILAGDIGGTKTLLGLFEPAPVRPHPLSVRAFGTLDHQELIDIIEIFLTEAKVAADDVATACFGVAGPVIDDAADLTNVPWRVEARAVTNAFHFRHVLLLND